MKIYGFSLGEILKINFRALGEIQRFGKKLPIIFSVVGFSVLFDYWDIWFMAILVDAIVEGRGNQVIVGSLTFYLGGKLILRIIDSVLVHYYYYQGSDVWDYANVSLDQKIMDMDYEYMESEQIQNQRRDIDEAAHADNGGGINTFYWRIFTFLRNLISISIAAVYMAQIIVKSGGMFPGHPLQSVFYSIGFILLIIILVIFGMKRVGWYSKQIFEETDKRIPYIREHVYYVNEYIEREATGKNIRLFHQQPLLLNHLHKLFEYIYASSQKTELFKKKQFGFTGMLQTGITCLVYFYLGILALKGVLTVGTVYLYASSIMVFVRCFSVWIGMLSVLMANTKYLKKYFDFLDIPNKKYEGTLPVEKRDDDQFELEFRNVSFHYPGSEKYVLKDFSIHFRIGERLAVVGKNGSGKTTFIKLLCRLYDPTEGEILLNGIDIRKYDYQEYLQLFSVVFQDFKLTALPLGQNVAAAEEYQEEKVKDALARGGLSDFWDTLPKGLDTALYADFDGEGVDISGGEAQKIAIARALYHDTPFVILDEPTAALDPLAEYEVYAGFDELVGTKTAVYISHRLSSCQFCNDIMVLDNGSVVQHGNHQELVEDKEGLYYQMWHAQAQYYQEKEG